MKVLHVIPSISKKAGGPSHAIVPMCRALKEHGVDVTLVTTDDALEDQMENGVVLEEPTLYQELPTLFFRNQLGASFKYSRPLAKWLDKNVTAYDVVHIHAVFNHSSIAAASACRKAHVPYVVRPLGTLDPWGMQQKSFRKKLFWRVKAKEMLSAAAGIHYTSSQEQQAVERSLGLNHGFVVPLGVAVETTAAPAVEANLNEEFGDLVHGPFVLVLSRLLPTKGLDILLDAFLSLISRPEFQSWLLVLAGDGPADYVSSLKQKVAEKRAENSVIFTGWLNGAKKDLALRNASLLALPSYHENFGLCVIEALAHGVPVLVSPHVNLSPDIVAAGAGWVADVDTDAIKSALTEAFSSKEELQRRGVAGRKLALEFTWSNIATKLFDVYASLIPGDNA